jgi:hypothetical protein
MILFSVVITQYGTGVLKRQKKPPRVAEGTTGRVVWNMTYIKSNICGQYWQGYEVSG